MNNNYTSKVDPALLLTPEQAVKEYEDVGGSITVFSQFGVDPLLQYPTLIQQREIELLSRHNFDTISIISSVVTSNLSWMDYFASSISLII